MDCPDFGKQNSDNAMLTENGKHKKIDWPLIAVRFLFGSIFGLCIGMSWSVWLWNGKHFIECVFFGVVLIGGLAAKFGDRFWETSNRWWNPLRWF